MKTKKLVKKLIISAIVTVASTMSLYAQTGRTVSLTWTDIINPPATTYNIKRAVGLCSGTPAFSTVASGITAKAYQDQNVPIGNYCYVITASFAGLESAPSNSAGAAVLPAPPVLGGVQIALLNPGAFSRWSGILAAMGF